MDLDDLDLQKIAEMSIIEEQKHLRVFCKVRFLPLYFLFKQILYFHSLKQE
jgi:hypothetical protein